MRNLYWRAEAKMRSLDERPFTSEQELERYIHEHRELLGGDIYIMRRQVRTGSHEGILDMIGVDQDHRVCIIELKNVEADESVLPQALAYAIWAETNPDSIKAIWLECDERPEDVELTWDNLDLRIILIAPSFKSTVQRMASKINYPVDLFQIQRYCLQDHEFVVVDALEESEERTPGVTTVKGDWDWDYYREEHGDEATAQVERAVQALDAYFREQGWDLPYNLNKNYVGFKFNNLLVATVHWHGTYAWKIELKLPDGVADGLSGESWEFQRYREQFSLAKISPLHPESVGTDIEEIKPLLVKAYHHVTGAD